MRSQIHSFGVVVVESFSLSADGSRVLGRAAKGATVWRSSDGATLYAIAP